MRAFLIEWLFVITMLVGFGAVGGFVVMPFRQALPFVLLVCPFVGLLVVAFGTSLAYNLLGLPFVIGLVATAIVGIAASAWSIRGLRLRPVWRSVAIPGLLMGLVTALLTAVVVSATIEVGSPALHYWTGTDHLGYAHPADWIIAHPPWDLPRVDPTVPYESWPALMLEADPRFGSIALVAMIGVVRGLPGTFAYEVACAVALSAAVLGVAAAFARSRLTLILLVIGLVTCHWYDYSRAGYLGRMLGYPAGALVIGLLLAAPTPLRPRTLGAILLTAAGAATVYVADATLLFIGTVGGTFVVARVFLARAGLLGRLRCLPWQHAVVIVLIAVVALTAKGSVARRWSPDAAAGGGLRTTINSLVDPTVGTGLSNRPWEEVRPTLLDLEQAHAPIGMLPRDLLNGAVVLARAAWLALIAIAVLRRDPAALALTLGPLLLLTLLNALPTEFARWVTAQLPGTFYPFMLCAAALLLDGARRDPGSSRVGQVATAGLAALMIVSIGLRVPRFVGSVERYVGTSTRTLPPFSLAEMDDLAAAIGSETVRVDVAEPHLVLVSLVELGRRGIELQWSPDAWFHVASYRGWSVPDPASPARLVLGSISEPLRDSVTVVYETPQYRLVRRVDQRQP